MQNEKPKLKFAVAVEMGDRWYCGPRRFSTEEDAREWGEQFYQSHPSVKACSRKARTSVSARHKNIPLFQ